jgi:hypothetical protein
MYIERVLNLNNGWSKLTTEKSEEWEEVKLALMKIDDRLILKGIDAAQTIENVQDGLEYVISLFMYTALDSFLKETFHWTELPVPNEKKDIYSNARSVKNGLSASIVGIDDQTGGDFINSLHINIPFYHQEDLVDLTVILVPTKETLNHLIALGASPIQSTRIPSEIFCREQFARFSLLYGQMPVVLAFFSPTAPKELIIEETTPLRVRGHTIERTIEFAPEYYQAGVGLLSYFGEVLRQKDPTTTARVRIEQDGTTVRLHIESTRGDIETIERVLEKFALVISDQLSPESLFENRAFVMKLENKLELTKLEVKHEQDLRQLTDGLNTHRINSLEKEITALRNQLSSQLQQTGQVIELATLQASSHERIHTALITHSEGIFKDLLREASGNQQLTEAVESLHRNLLSGIAAVDIEDQLERALSTIKKEDAGFLSRIFTELKGAAYKASATSSLTWVTNWIATHLAL